MCPIAVVPSKVQFSLDTLRSLHVIIQLKLHFAMTSKIFAHKQILARNKCLNYSFFQDVVRPTVRILQW